LEKDKGGTMHKHSKGRIGKLLAWARQAALFGKDKVTPVNHVLLGNISGECPSTAKIVRIFTSSTFTGT
jgi:hypothetical protein